MSHENSVNKAKLGTYVQTCQFVLTWHNCPPIQASRMDMTACLSLSLLTGLAGIVVDTSCSRFPFTSDEMLPQQSWPWLRMSSLFSATATPETITHKKARSHGRFGPAGRSNL
uniref:Uncharacterized protein n=1 Tax=Nelumbo nucifera TaxID=4432 RepID=A0A822XPP2_NELNU|nr:TPA_asm: hypothetical protein HUJ06_023740 [Nelumbo nucifera]